MHIYTCMYIECFELRVSRVGVVFEFVLNLESKRRTAGSQVDNRSSARRVIVCQQLQGGGACEHDEMHARSDNLKLHVHVHTSPLA
jgi:hypothetical protein